ncbi:thioredoxin reductase-like selenoprotein T homolog CG3887 [Agrilus planipennis]|uniref:Thioredoxin reductase-like selenoprotein T homolog CG3887 n=1 Tax=Agrilus planipennis TaxID=224129 RepID=A0A1W4WGD0_AGRPL|nr:thioredoxin reductase-like selenoprotein T homolog CG3887 [Agrilus planipennis]
MSAITNKIIFSTLLFFFAAPCYLTNSQSEIPRTTKFSQSVGSPTMKFLYCYSCGYRKAFEEYSNIIHQKYPEILIEGTNYEPPGLNMFFSRLIGVIKIMIILCIIGRVNIFHYFNQPQPSWWSWCMENKIYACMMLFFVSKIFEDQLLQSGAFEISLNNVPVWSKIETGRIPQPAELFQIIDSHLQFTDNLNSGFAK